MEAGRVDGATRAAQLRRNNRRLGWYLAILALVFFAGFIVEQALKV